MGGGLVRHILGWRQWQRAVVVGLGVILVAVPTLFAIFPAWTTLWFPWRILVAAGWLGAAVGAVVVAAVSDDELHGRVDASVQRAILAERRDVMRDHLQALLVPGAGGLPPQYQVTLYAPSADGAYLVPLYPPALSARDPAIFPVGAGATGKVWLQPDEIFVAKGPAVSNQEHGLSLRQSRRYGPFQTVAASVIRDDDDVPVGVITALGREDDGAFDDETGAEQLESLGHMIAWLIPSAVECMMLTKDDTDDTRSS